MKRNNLSLFSCLTKGVQSNTGVGLVICPSVARQEQGDGADGSLMHDTPLTMRT